jgi:hypothetical protein
MSVTSANQQVLQGSHTHRNPETSNLIPNGVFPGA